MTHARWSVVGLPLLFFPLLPQAAPPPIQTRTLDDGLQVLVVENHSIPLVHIEIAAKNGSMTEPPEYNGLSHLYEHMFFKANAVLPNQEAFMARLRELGMVWNGTTNTERVNYFFTTTSDHTKDAMVFMRDAVVSPLFDKTEFEKEREVVVGEIDRNDASPFYHLNHEVTRHLFWKYPSRKDPLGSRETVRAATAEMMRTIQHRYYVPNNSVLVVIGDAKAEDVFAQATELYQDWKRSEDPFQKFPLVHHPPLPRTEVVHVEQPVQTVNGEMMWQGPSTIGKDVSLTYAADVLTTAISEPSSKFQKDLVDSGLCVSAGISWFTQMNMGPITFAFETQPDKVDAAVKAAIAELSKMKARDYFSDAEIHNAAHTIEVQQAETRERVDGLAHDLTFWWTSAGLDYYRGYVDNCYKVTRADFARYLDTYMIGHPFVFGVMVSPEMAKEKNLDQAHFESLMGLAGASRARPGSRKGASQ